MPTATHRDPLRLRKWAHMLGYGGHFSSKSRRYSVTLTQLRQARADYAARQDHNEGQGEGQPQPDSDVRIHRVTTAMALGDVQVALDLIPRIDTSGLPTERRVRHSLEVVNAYHARNKVSRAIDEPLTAERRAPEQVHEHVMSRQLVLRLRATGLGKRSRTLAGLARRMRLI